MSDPVLVVGSFNQDLTWDTPRFPVPGETSVGRFRTGPGGKGSNQAVAAARTGVPTIFVGAIGDDPFGDALPAFYEGEGIEARLAVKPGEPTGNAGIWVDRTGQNVIIVALGSNLLLEPADLPADALARAAVVVCQNEIAPEMTAFSLKAAREAGKTTILNPAPMLADFDRSVLQHVDIFIPNETEFVELLRQLHPAFEPGGAEEIGEETIAGLEPEALHTLCRRLDVPTVIVTLGARGCLVSTATGQRLIPAHTGIDVVDTTGAGDAFVGGFASGLVQLGGDIFEAAVYGTATAALSVTRPGTAPSMPRRDEIEALVAGSRR